MGKRILFTLAFFLVLNPEAFSAPLTLSTAFKAAVERTETMPIAESRVHEAEAQTDRFHGAFFPELSAGATYERQSTVINTKGKYDQSNTKLTLTESLLAGGRDRANVNAAAANTRAEEFNRTDTRNNLYVQVAAAFYGLLSARREVENIQKSIDLTQQRINELGKRKKIGKSRNIEILAVASQRSVLQAQLVAAVAARRVAKNNFANVTGLDRNTELNDDATLPAEVKNLPALLTKVESRPDVLALGATVESSNSLVSAARSGYFTSLDLQANYYPSRYNYQTTAPDWDAQLTFTLPIFSGGITKASVREAEEVRNQSELFLSQGKRNAETEIHTAYNNLASSLEQVKALEKAVAATEQNYREQEKDYRYSLATNLDVLQALLTYYDTKRTLDRTRYQALSSAAELKAAINELGE